MHICLIYIIKLVSSKNSSFCIVCIGKTILIYMEIYYTEILLVKYNIKLFNQRLST